MVMTLKFELPIIYKNTGIPPRHRREQDYSVLDKAWFEFPIADTSELEPALTFRMHYRLKDDDSLHMDDTVFKQCRGHLVLASYASGRFRTDRSLNVGFLAELGGREGIRHLPELLRVKSFNFWYTYGTPFAVEALDLQKIAISRRDEAIEELQSFITDNLVIVDGTVYNKIHDPKINVSVSGDGYAVKRSLIAQGRYSFPFNRDDLVEEFTHWLEREKGVRSKPDTTGWEGGIEFISDADNVPLSANPVIEAGLALAELAQLNISNAAYWGDDVKRLGLALRADPSVENTFAFAAAFEESAKLPGAHKVGYGMDDVDLLFSSFRKFLELMPDEYKPGFTDTIEIPMAFASPQAIKRT